MTLPIVFHPDVHGDVDAAYRWYEQQGPGLGDNLLDAIDEVYARITPNPKIHQVIYDNVRRALCRRFPYSIFYRVHPDRIEVIAVYHNRRDPKGWQSRA